MVYHINITKHSYGPERASYSYTILNENGKIVTEERDFETYDIAKRCAKANTYYISSLTSDEQFKYYLETLMEHPNFKENFINFLLNQPT
jgi:hypothetical protein